MKNIDLVVKICKLHYEKDLNYTQIGKKLRLSRFQVSNIIKQARSASIVRYYIE